MSPKKEKKKKGEKKSKKKKAEKEETSKSENDEKSSGSKGEESKTSSPGNKLLNYLKAMPIEMNKILYFAALVLEGFYLIKY